MRQVVRNDKDERIPIQGKIAAEIAKRLEIFAVNGYAGRNSVPIEGIPS